MVPEGRQEAHHGESVLDTRSLVDNIRSKLIVHENQLVGCTRRHIWMDDEDLPWYMIKGNAYLRVIATPHVVATPVGLIGIWWYDGTLVDFRGGPWRPWWETDLHETWALAKEYAGLNPRPYVYVLHEDRGVLKSRKIEVEPLTSDEIGEIIRRAEKEPYGRLAKNTARAYHTCKSCPVKRECDTQDKITPGGTADWGSSYPVP